MLHYYLVTIMARLVSIIDNVLINACFVCQLGRLVIIMTNSVCPHLLMFN
jgi:hypothetical protein